MYSRIINIVALNEMQLNMFIENFKNTGAKIEKYEGDVPFLALNPTKDLNKLKM